MQFRKNLCLNDYSHKTDNVANLLVNYSVTYNLFTSARYNGGVIKFYGLVFWWAETENPDDKVEGNHWVKYDRWNRKTRFRNYMWWLLQNNKAIIAWVVQ